MFHGGDYPAPSAFDSILWLGVQPAVKEMFIRLLKTVEHQSIELNRLDQQYKSFLSERDGSVRILMDKVSDSYSCINTKADKKNVAGLKREMLEVKIKAIRIAEQSCSACFRNTSLCMKSEFSFRTFRTEILFCNIGLRKQSSSLSYCINHRHSLPLPFLLQFRNILFYALYDHTPLYDTVLYYFYIPIDKNTKG